MEAWIPITIAAAFCQNIRSAAQKRLHDSLSLTAAASVRFLFALPIGAAYLWGLHHFGAMDLPTMNARFLLYCALGGVCQILFSVFLLWMFSFRNFAVGTTFAKLEVPMVALFGALLLGDSLNPLAWLAVALSACGVIALSAPRIKRARRVDSMRETMQAVMREMLRKPTAIGLGAAAWLGASVVFFRGAALSLNHPRASMAAAFALLVALCIQTALLLSWLALREPAQCKRIARHWRLCSAVGVAGALASIGWFSAFTMQNAAHVRALGQIELLFAFVAATLFFKERVRRIEILGIALVAGGVIVIALA